MSIVTLFNNNSDTTPKTHNLSTEQFVDTYVRQPQIRDQKDGIAWSPASFKADSSRSDSAVNALHWLVLDLDSSDTRNINIDEFLQSVEFEYIFHTSHSHTVTKPKFRVILPLDRPAEPREWACVYEGAFKLFPDMDMACRNLSRHYFLPAHKENAPYDWDYVPGEKIKVDDLIKKSGYQVTDTVQHISAAKSGGRNDVLKSVVRAMLQRGCQIPEIVDEVIQHDAMHHNPPLFSDMTEPQMRGSVHANATVFVSNIYKSVSASLGDALVPMVTTAPADFALANVHHFDVNLIGVDFPPFPNIDIPGIVGELRDYIEACASHAQPNLALAASLAAVGAVVGRKVETETGLRSNIYAMGVAESGSGKENARSVIKRVFEEAGLDDTYLGGESFASGSGLLKSVCEKPSALFLIDEFGHEMAKYSSENAAASSVPSMMMKLFTSANTTYRGQEAATVDRNDVKCPNPCIYTTSTPEMLFKSMSSDRIADGFLGRWLVFHSDDNNPPRLRKRKFKTPPQIIEKLRVLHQYVAGVQGDFQVTINSPEYNPTPIEIRTTEAAWQILDKYAQKWDEEKVNAKGSDRAIWVRAWEHANKIALVLAAGHNDLIDQREMLAACQIVDYLTQQMVHHVKSVGGVSEFYSQVKQVMDFILENDGVVKAGSITSHLRIKSKDVKEIIAFLKEGEYVDVEMLSTGGRPSTLVTLSDLFKKWCAEKSAVKTPNYSNMHK